MNTSTTTSAARGTWGSRLTFILAAAGSAIGLGNIWRFPIATAEGGGGAFVLIYILCAAFVGLPVMLAEMVVGRAGERNPVGAIAHLGNGTNWRWIGGLGVLASFIVLSFYSVISGWTIYYMISASIGTFKETLDTDAFFAKLVAHPGKEIFYHGIFMIVTILTVAAGIRNGIERTIKIAMPILGLVLLVLLVRAVTLPGALEGLTYYLMPDFSKVTANTVLQALAQAFFSLSLGMGAIVTYGSYLRKNESLPTSAGYVVVMDTTVALLAGCIIFPALVYANLPLDKAGPGLIFQVLPQVFVQLPWQPWGGIFFGATFFLLLSIAAYTSAISLLEVSVSYFVDEKGWNRKKAAWTLGGGAFLLGIPSALSLGAVNWLTELPGIGMSLIDLLSGPLTDGALVLGALGLSLFVGWKWGLKRALVEIRKGSPEFKLTSIWAASIRFVAPVAISMILAFQLYSLFASDTPAEENSEDPVIETANF